MAGFLVLESAADLLFQDGDVYLLESGSEVVPIVASSDDAIEIPAASPVLTDADLVGDAVDEHWGFRFQALAIPQGATINTATITLTLSDNAKNDAEGTWFGQAIDDAPTFTTTNGDVDGRTKTSASVAWTTNDLGSLGDDIVTPSLVTIVQEIVNRAGWVSGNDMVFLYVHNSAVDELQVATWDTANWHPAQLFVEFTAAVPGPAKLRRQRQPYQWGLTTR